MKKLSILTLTLLLVSGTANAQFLKRLGDKAKQAAERVIENKTEKAAEKVTDKATDIDTYTGNGQGSASTGSATGGTDAQGNPVQQTPQSAQMGYNKFDFVSGDEIMFEDNLAGEQLGEFPSMWDLISGNAEVATINGEKVIAFVESAEITPLMKTPKNYLPEDYTIEADFYVPSSGAAGYFYFKVLDGNEEIIRNNVSFLVFGQPGLNFSERAKSTSGEWRENKETLPLAAGWHRISLSFNKRALKVYIDERRVVNMPNIAQGKWFSIIGRANTTASGTFYVKNVRIAKGAVPLYDRMMSEGKFITYGITFDVGKSSIKPESMGEINRIVQLMTENPDLKFSVEGHTDSTGNAASNQTLSEARSKAIVDKLVSLGIATDRLFSSGKGQNNPIADNGTDEGRAKNRRVEFVKK